MQQSLHYPELTSRQETLFTALLEQYVHSARAISSQRLAEITELAVSPATIRNELAEMEEIGLVTQPHTSAGRIPTDLGYGFYVDSLMKTVRLPMKDRKAIMSAIREAHTGALEEMLERISIVLSRVTTLISIVLSPSLLDSTLHKLDLVRISSERLLVVLTLKSGFVKSIILEIKSDIREEDIRETVDFLNDRLSGVKLAVLRDSMRERLKGSGKKVNLELIGLIVDVALPLFRNEIVEFHIGETRHVFDQPEFSDPERMRGVFELIDDRIELADLFQIGEHQPAEGIRIAIGQELSSERVQGCSVITTRYSIGDTEGNLGVIGPTRMDYPWLVSLINFTSAAIQKRLVD